MKAYLLALVCVFLLSSCATLDENECLNADWNLIGFEDGSNGLALERIGKHRKACAKVNVIPDFTAYEKGHQKGARKYCTPERGYALGVGGGADPGICPADLASAFTRAFRDGQELYSLKQLINSTVTALNNYRAEIVQIEADIAEHERTIVSSQTSSVQRKESLVAIKDLQRDITDLEISSSEAEQELRMLENDYQAVLRQHQLWGY
jgi:Protein of unknown function (DUF2799)